MHRVVIDDPASLFTGHPDPDIDVTVAPISGALVALREQGHYCFFRSFNPSLAMKDEDAEILDAMERVTFIGYPNGLYDAVTGLPIARQGITATPVTTDYCSEPIFLIDASVFPGSSGSPVLVADTGSFSVRGKGHVGERMVLLGVVAAAYQRDVPILKARAEGPAFIRDLIDVGIVYKARTIDETVDDVLSKIGVERGPDQPAEQISEPKGELA